MSKELTKKQETSLSTEMNSAWGAEEVDRGDILIPKVLTMQAMSQFVTAEKAQMGDFVDSVTGEILGSARESSKQKPLEFVPIMHTKTWSHYEKVDGKWEFRGVEPFTAENAGFPIKEYAKPDGTTWRHDRCLNFFVLLPAKALDGGLPYLLSFRRTSYRCGQKLATHFLLCRGANGGRGVPPASATFKLLGKKVTNADNQTYYVTDSEKVGPTDPALVEIAYQWFKTLKAGAVKVDNSDLAESETKSQGSDLTEDAEY